MGREAERDENRGRERWEERQREIGREAERDRTVLSILEAD